MGSLLAKLSRGIGTAIADYGMIESGDVVAVAVSGGKDSLTLLDILINMRQRSPVKFDLVAVTVDQGYEGFRWPVMERHFRALGVPYHIESTRISDLIEDHKTPGSTWCALCARLRRGVLYRLAGEKGWSKIALGHHADDLIETHLLSQLFNGVVQSMPPILRSRERGHVVIRPMCSIWERQVIAYTKERALPVICCACPACRDLNLKRRRVKALLQDLEDSWPGIKQSLLGAQRRLKLTQLMDPRFLPLGREARLAAVAGASPYWGIAQQGGDVTEEPGEGFEPAIAGENGRGAGLSPGALLSIGPAHAGAALVPPPRDRAEPATLVTETPRDPSRPSRGFRPATNRDLRPGSSPEVSEGAAPGPRRSAEPGHPVPRETEVPAETSASAEGTGCGATCTCGPLA
jgi:tRNA 2-thiocytidine biosynthesis protein TtcA